jgi:hypothetical protein
MSGGFQHDVAGGQGNLIIPQLQSPNFSLADQTGWAILRNGDAYFFNITAEGSVTSNTVIVKGSGDGVFVYDGIPALNTLVVAIASTAGTDEFGNAYSGPGISVSAPGPDGGKNEIQIRPDKNAVLIYAA